MSELTFEYLMRSDFERPIYNHAFRLMLLPPDTGRQKVLHLEAEIAPKSWISQGQDGFGNRYFYGTAVEGHSTFTACVRGTVQTGLEGPEDDADPILYTIPTPTTAPGPSAISLYQSVNAPDGADAMARAECLMAALRRNLQYVPGVTDTTSSSEAALRQGSGVCQDFTQVLLTLCRMDGIPARYVAGMVIGEGKTHAWAEVWSDGAWHGLDPTWGRRVNGDYIELCHGRDCRDCLLNRGVYAGPAMENQMITVSVKNV